MTSPGFIPISTITVLASPHTVDPTKGDRNIVFDANFFIVHGSQTSSLGLLRYFIPDDMIELVRKMNDKAFQKAFVVANITSIKKNSIPNVLLIEGTEFTDYAFVGDIVQLIIINGDTNVKTHPHITAAGVVTEYNRNNHSFSMRPSQYAALPHATSPLPIHGEFMESKRWGNNGPPKVSIGTTVALSGFIEVIRRDGPSQTVTSVEVEVVNVTFLSSRGGSQTVPNRLPTHGQGPQTRFNYDNPNMDGDNISPSSQQGEAGPSAIAKGKRKCENGDLSDDEKDLKREHTLSNSGDVEDEK
ncbi:hypothetical protein GALMADRAFT_144341 [Galerina marginata CBS 339.88]|uniref:Uncharacterized protein n=1 Tax=Galerina marginata (strain CBS 339.88) TaxID=685588 RepID=A0A067SLG6_GALM3|nr:hypothetical protein GALMADRAFT_144341 [Galerina marginata CBS 339.88]